MILEKPSSKKGFFPPQNIEAVFDIKNSNYYISDTCQNSLTSYSYKNSETFIKTETDEKPFSYG